MGILIDRERSLSGFSGLGKVNQIKFYIVLYINARCRLLLMFQLNISKLLICKTGFQRAEFHILSPSLLKKDIGKYLTG